MTLAHYRSQVILWWRLPSLYHFPWQLKNNWPGYLEVIEKDYLAAVDGSEAWAIEFRLHEGAEMAFIDELRLIYCLCEESQGIQKDHQIWKVSAMNWKQNFCDFIDYHKQTAFRLLKIILAFRQEPPWWKPKIKYWLLSLAWCWAVHN